MSKHISEVNESNFEQDVLRSASPVLVEFWAAWCAPCRFLAPIVETVAEKYVDRARVAKLNVDQNQTVSQRFGIKGIPTLVLFNDGAEQERVVGVTSEEVISLMIEKYLRESNSLKNK